MLIPSILATYRLAYLFTQEDGPLMVFAKLRSVAGAVPVLGEALQCPYCFSLWAAVPVVALNLFGLGVIVEVLALSGGAMFLYEAIEAMKSVGVLDEASQVAESDPMAESDPIDVPSEPAGVEVAGLEM